MSSSKLRILPLPHPLVLLPSARLTFPVSRSVAAVLVDLIDDQQPVLAAVPVISPSRTISASVDANNTDGALCEYGTAVRVTRLSRPPARNPRQPYMLTLQGLSRIRICGPLPPSTGAATLVEHDIEYADEGGVPDREVVETFKSAALRLLDRLAGDATQQSRREGWVKVATMVEDISADKAGWLADAIISLVNAEYSDKLAFLSTPNATDRLKLATELFTKQASISEVQRKIATAVDESLSKQQKEFFLRQQMAAIERELQNLHNKPSSKGTISGGSPRSEEKSGSELDDDAHAEEEDMADLKRGIEAMEPGSEERKMGVREWRRLKRIPAGSVENGVIRSYLEWLVAIPWPKSSATAREDTKALQDPVFLSRAREQLDADHFGLEKVKRRLIEYVAIVRLKEMNAAREAEAQSKALVKRDENPPAPTVKRPAKKGVKGPILLFQGPPGVGKTSLGQSIAKALNRPFQRISLGGVRDEAEIRGHRRTYVASGPGLIVQALRKAGRADPVLLLDEIDKVGGSNFHGDPAAALLEVLDPEQNHSFNDHYVNVPVDLSEVLFICTSNTLDTIAAPLLDRCEIIQLSGYTYDEKVSIAKRFLLPKQVAANGLPPTHVQLTDGALQTIATHYTREAGVRSLERAIGAVARYKAVQWAEHVDSGKPEDDAGYKRTVEESELEAILGIARWDGEEREREQRKGVVYGLVVTGLGEGGILPVESITVPGSGKLKLTGSLGEVIKESGEIALSWVKTHAYDLCITNSRAEDPMKVPDPIDVHLHLPAGAQKKDGPSAGIAMTCALVSLLTGACVPSNVAMTGEITLRGRVTPVGGIKEKVLGAHRAQITKVILPWANRKDVEHDVAAEVRDAMQFVFVRTISEALEAAFGKGTLGWRRNTVLLESRL